MPFHNLLTQSTLEVLLLFGGLIKREAGATSTSLRSHARDEGRRCRCHCGLLLLHSSHPIPSSPLGNTCAWRGHDIALTQHSHSGFLGVNLERLGGRRGVGGLGNGHCRFLHVCPQPQPQSSFFQFQIRDGGLLTS